MHFISLIASERKKGNSELLGTLALNEALAHGATGELVFLRDYNIEECDGCMSCVFRKVPCHLQDDTYKLLDKIASADALFLAAPTYVLGIPGKLKLIMDKYLLIPHYYNKIYGRPAVSIGTGGLADWNHFQLPQMNLFLIGLGFRVIDSFYARGAGPGETLLNDEVVRRLKTGVKSAQDWKPVPFKSQLSKHCPVCFSTVFERTEDNKYKCPVCAVEAEQQEETLYFSAETLNSHRWTPEGVEDHFTNWILKTKDRFKGRLKDIQDKKRELGLK
jgi:multimeric flavodoxin WrbA